MARVEVTREGVSSAIVCPLCGDEANSLREVFPNRPVCLNCYIDVSLETKGSDEILDSLLGASRSEI